MVETLDAAGEVMSPENDKINLLFLRRMAIYNYFRGHVADRKVLEVGFGDGYGTYGLASVAKEITGTEVTLSLVERARAAYVRENLYYLKGDMDRLPFPDAAFDVIVSTHTLEHVRDHMKFLREAHRVLKAGGEAVIATHNRKAVLDNPYCRREFSAKQFSKALRKVFGDVEVSGLRGSERYAAQAGGMGLARKVLTHDVLGIRRFMPRFVVVPLCKRALESAGEMAVAQGQDGITIDDFQVTKYEARHSLDLIGVCKK